MIKNIVKKNFDIIISFFSVAGILILLFFCLGYVPFGENSLAIMDADIQYIDFFAYYRSVLLGENDILYTFTKTLGGSSIGLFSYYLASPLNLLVVFFENEQLQLFFHVLIILKLALAGSTFACFLKVRFKSYLKEKRYGNLFVIVLSIGFALSQYSISQCSNIMWLDGVYMLPLVLIGVYELIEYKKIFKLSIFVGLSIIFNWYTAGINCLFSIIWFIFELCLQQSEIENISIKNRTKESLAVLFKYVCSMLLGVLLSSFLFLPTIFDVSGSSRGDLNLSLLLDFTFIGNITSIIEGYSLGGKSEYGVVSLYCGSIAILGLIGCMISKNISKIKKVIFAIMALINVLLFYFGPFLGLFSLLKRADSYWYRYSYCGIVGILFLAAFFFFTTDFYEEIYIFIKGTVLFSILLIISNYINNSQDRKLIILTIVFVVLISSSIVFWIKSINKSKIIQIISSMIMIILVIIDITYSVKLQMDNNHVSNVSEYKSYVNNQQKQINKIKEFDKEYYRISQTSTRKMGEDNLTPYYNESLAYNYWSISGYTSIQDNIQRKFLHRVGYPACGETMCITNTSIITADSLMGVKYILSKYPINGLKKLDNFESYNEKYVYENIYSLPFAFVYKENDLEYKVVSNPFEYQNILYSKLIGEEIDLFVPVNFEKNIAEDNISYSLSVPQGNYALYGNILYNYSEKKKINLNINDIYNIGYASWLSPSVFYIPTKYDGEDVKVKLSNIPKGVLKDEKEQFYLLDLDLLELKVEELRNNKVENIEIKNGNVKLSVEAKKGERLFLSIPADDSWIVKLNGNTIKPEFFGECMYSIPLDEGKNDINMEYEVRFLKTGIVASVFGILILIFIYIREKIL